MSKLGPGEFILNIGTNGLVTLHLTEPEVIRPGKRTGFLLLARVTAVKCVAEDAVVTWVLTLLP